METTVRDMIADHVAAVGRLNEGHRRTIAAAAQLLLDCYGAGGKVLVCGNGGSAADSQHIAGELTGRFLRERPGLSCIALNTDTSILTAIGNDYSFDYVFARQVEAHLRPGDVLWGITTSGNSPNVLAAAEAARKAGGKVLGFAGRDGGRLKALEQCLLHRPGREDLRHPADPPTGLPRDLRAGGPPGRSAGQTKGLRPCPTKRYSWIATAR